MKGRAVVEVMARASHLLHIIAPSHQAALTRLPHHTPDETETRGSITYQPLRKYNSQQLGSYFPSQNMGGWELRKALEKRAQLTKLLAFSKGQAPVPLKGSVLCVKLCRVGRHEFGRGQHQAVSKMRTVVSFV